MWTEHPNLPDVRQRYLFDDGRMIRQKVQDVEPTIDAAQRLRNETGGWTPNRVMRKAASIPATIYYDWIADWQRKGLLPEHNHPSFHSMANELCLKRVRNGDFSKFRV